MWRDRDAGHPVRVQRLSREHQMATPTGPRSTREAALETTRPRLRAFIARRVESPDIAEDLTQDVLLRLVKSKEGHLENPTAWLYRVARNVIIDHYRSRRTEPLLDPAGAVSPDPAEDPFAEDPQEAHRELAGCLRSLVAELDEPYRSAITAVDLDGQTQTEFAHTTGLSISGMKSRVQRGRHQLRTLLTDCCPVQTNAAGSISGYVPSTRCEADPNKGDTMSCLGRANAG